MTVLYVSEPTHRILQLQKWMQLSSHLQFNTNNFSPSASSDYISLDTTLTFSDSVTSHRINITINVDTIDELNEKFTANLELITDRDNVNIDPAQTVITIVDDDSES